MDQESLKEGIIRLRVLSNKTQKEIYEALGMKRSVYENLEKPVNKGGTKLINDHVFEIAKFHDVSLAEMWFEKEAYIMKELGWEDKIASIQKEYEGRIARMQEECDHLASRVKDMSNTIKAKDDTIRTKDELINMLKRRK